MIGHCPTLSRLAEDRTDRTTPYKGVHVCPIRSGCVGRLGERFAKPFPSLTLPLASQKEKPDLDVSGEDRTSELAGPG